MSYRQIFLDGRGNFLAESTIESQFIHADLAEPLSGAYICQWCGDVWARQIVTRPSGSMTQWQFFRHPCSKCAPRCTHYLSFPGSIWRSWDKAFLESLPVEILRREVLTLLDWFESRGCGMVSLESNEYDTITVPHRPDLRTI